MRKVKTLFSAGVTLALLSSAIYPVYASSTEMVVAKGTSEEYIPPGVVINEPPKGWNPLKASDEELKQYGYPPRPSNPDELQEWQGLVSGEWLRPKFGKPEPHKHFGPMVNHLRDGRKKPKTSESLAPDSSSFISPDAVEKTSDIWSGVVDKGTRTRVVGWWQRQLQSQIWKLQ